MLVTTQDIYYLSHAYKNVCEAKCHLPECVEESVSIMIMNNIIKTNLMYSQQLCSSNNVKEPIKSTEFKIK